MLSGNLGPISSFLFVELSSMVALVQIMCSYLALLTWFQARLILRDFRARHFWGDL